MNNKGYISKGLSLLLIPILLYIGINNLANVHYHKMADGTVVCHSHPFGSGSQESPFESHHHSATSYLVLQQVNTFSFLVIIAILLLSGLLYLRSIKTILLQNYGPILPYSFISLRGPPIFS